MVNGRRITDAETLKVVTMVYGGLVNKNIVAGLQELGGKLGSRASSPMHQDLEGRDNGLWRVGE